MERFLKDFEFWFDGGCLHYSREKQALKIINGEGSSTIVANVLGINPEDITVKIEDGYNISYIVIDGKTTDEITKQEYSVNYKLSVQSQRVEKIKKTIKNGLLFLEVVKKQPEASKIIIE